MDSSSINIFGFVVNADWVTAAATVIYTIGTFALWWTTGNALTEAGRSAKAAEISSKITQAGFENVTKQHKALSSDYKKTFNWPSSIRDR